MTVHKGLTPKEIYFEEIAQARREVIDDQSYLGFIDEVDKFGIIASNGETMTYLPHLIPKNEVMDVLISVCKIGGTGKLRDGLTRLYDEFPFINSTHPSDWKYNSQGNPCTTMGEKRAVVKYIEEKMISDNLDDTKENKKKIGTELGIRYRTYQNYKNDIKAKEREFIDNLSSAADFDNQELDDALFYFRQDEINKFKLILTAQIEKKVISKRNIKLYNTLLNLPQYPRSGRGPFL